MYSIYIHIHIYIYIYIYIIVYVEVLHIFTNIPSTRLTHSETHGILFNRIRARNSSRLFSNSSCVACSSCRAKKIFTQWLLVENKWLINPYGSSRTFLFRKWDWGIMYNNFEG